MKNIFKTYCLVIAAIIGAGFSSGKEILIFFDERLQIGSLNIIFSVILFFITIYLVLYISNKNKIYNYRQFVIYITNEKVGKIINNIIRYFILLIFFTMIAGFGAFINQVLNISSIFGSIVISIITYITLKYNIDGIIKISTYIVPVIILGIVLLLINQTEYIPNIIQNNIYILRKINTYISGIIYTSYNLVIVIPIILSTSNLIKNRKEIFITSLFISLTLGLLVLIIYYIINLNLPNIIYYDMPLLYIANKINIFSYIYYIVVISFAIYTTTISTAYSFLEEYQNNKHTYKRFLIIICVFGIVISNIGFSKLVEYGFSLIGYFGIIQLIFIVKKYIHQK